MYNRSERIQTYINKDTLDPRLGPGQYTSPTLYPLPIGKSQGAQLKVPFLSKSLPTKTVTTPLAPTTYQTQKSETSQVPIFKQTNHSRFPDTIPLQVPPNTYTIVSSMTPKLPTIYSTLHKVFVGALNKEPLVRDDVVQWRSVKTIPSIPYPDHGFTTAAAKGKISLNSTYNQAAHVVLEDNADNHATNHATRQEGFLFPKTIKSLRFDTPDSPGPLYYETIEADRALYYKTAENAIGDVNFRGPKSRLIQSTIEISIKDNNPGVGRYEIASQNKSARFTIPKASRDGQREEYPSPQQYGKIVQWSDKPQSRSLYDSTVDRFIQRACDKSPEPGSYNLASLFEDVIRKTDTRSDNIRYGFGSITNRFQAQDKQCTPDPGAYHSISTPPLSLGRRSIDGDDVGFGSTDVRFSKYRAMTPAPSDYRPGESFQQVLAHGKIVKSLAVGSKFRKSKPVHQPCPCLYNVRGDKVKSFDSVFRSKTPRFVGGLLEKEIAPSPNAYQIRDDMVKGTFNVTLGANGCW